MRVEVAKSAGFCYGVKRAVELAEKAAGSGGNCYMLGSIIHNAHVVDHLEKLDLIEDLQKHLKEGGKIIIGDLSFESLKIQKEFKKQTETRI